MIETIKIEILGAGGAWDELTTAYLINDRLQVDCGVEVTKKLLKADRLRNIETLLLTHLHQDHVGGLETILFWRRLIDHSEQDLHIIAGPDFLQYYDALKASIDYDGHYIRAFRFTQLDDLAPKPQQASGLAITPHAVVHGFHTVPAFGFRLVNASGHQVVISGDTDEPVTFMTPDELRQEHSILLFHDMGWGDDWPRENKVHPTESEVYTRFGNTEKLIGIHTSVALKRYRQARAGDVFMV
jgi:ribonuclease BN (tRNA processing enzyme)